MVKPDWRWRSLAILPWSSMTGIAMAKHDCMLSHGECELRSAPPRHRAGTRIKAAMDRQYSSFLFGSRLPSIDRSSSTGLHIPLTNSRPALAVEIGVRSG